jgi:hypothetical protein
MQTTPYLLMIRPVRFGFNAETAVSNTFQNAGEEDEGTLQAKALVEFEAMVAALRNAGAEVLVLDDTTEPHTPDSIFPNNWISLHEDGNVFLYPMQAENRRWERREDILQMIDHQFSVKEKIDLSAYEISQKFLEGTGSMVLDRENKIVYACLSPRTDADLLHVFAEKTGYRIVDFHAFSDGKEIYHTNVVMSLGEKYAVVCLDAVPDFAERLTLLNNLVQTDKEVIEISEEQMNHFAGNMLQIRNLQGELLLVMSEQAYSSLSRQQIYALSQHGRIIHPDLKTIETSGGGSARCMIAEIHLPKR